MAVTVPQPPPMAYAPRTSSERYSPASAYLKGKQPYGSSPYSPRTSQSPDSPRIPKASLESYRALGMAVSEKSSFSSTSSGPASPISYSYSPAVQSALRDSCHSSLSSQLRHSGLASPHPLKQAPASRDLEKQQIPARGSRDSDRTQPRYNDSSYGAVEREDELSPRIEDKALRILVYLSGINCFVSLIILFYTVLALIATTLLSPFRICTSGTSFQKQTIAFLAPTLKIQLAFIYSPFGPEATDFSAPMLVMINLLSPLISLGVAGASWVAAAFWFFNAILGDPDGSDKPKGYNDGRASVIGVRKWWERWLVRPIRS